MKSLVLDVGLYQAGRCVKTVGSDSEARQAHRIWRACHQVPYALATPGACYAHQHLAIARNRLVNIYESQYVDRAVRIPHESLAEHCPR